jgi:hypothetical protein
LSIGEFVFPTGWTCYRDITFLKQSVQKIWPIPRSACAWLHVYGPEQSAMYALPWTPQLCYTMRGGPSRRGLRADRKNIVRHGRGFVPFAPAEEEDHEKNPDR